MSNGSNADEGMSEAYSDIKLIAYWEGCLGADEKTRMDEDIRVNPGLRKRLKKVIEMHLRRKKRISGQDE